MVLQLKTRRDFEALVLGTSIYATGGGGDPHEGLRRLLQTFVDRGRSLKILELNELSGGDYVASPYNVGSMAPTSKPKRLVYENTVLEALRIFREKLGVRLSAFMPVELGGGNTAVALEAAGQAGLPAVDADRVGRAAPEIHQDSALLAGFKLTPAVAVTPTGNIMIILSYSDIDDYESILRHLSILGGYATVIDTPLPVEKARKAVIEGSVSRAYELGKLVLELREKGSNNIPEKIAEAMNGWLVFYGKVSKWDWRDEGGFLVGEMVLEGLGEFKGRRLRSWVKNEHIMVWLNDEPLVMPPDLFTLVNANGEPIINSRVRIGLEVYGIAAPAPSIWRTSKGLELFGPRHFGFNYDYIPVEKLVKRHGLA